MDERVELSCRLKRDDPANREILLAFLATNGFEAFEETVEYVRAYIPVEDFREDRLAELMESLRPLIGSIEHSFTTLAGKNWNEEWEKNFQPVIIDGTCLIRAPFHQVDGDFSHEIILTPKMSFGTGHHPTTSLMISQLLKLDCRNKRVLDMGCGTAILSILAEKKGAREVVAIDNNDWAVANARENIVNNSCRQVRILNGDSGMLQKLGSFDILLANINLNVIRDDLGIYAGAMAGNGLLVTSGYFADQARVVACEARAHGLGLLNENLKEGWISQVFTRTGRQ